MGRDGRQMQAKVQLEKRVKRQGEAAWPGKGCLIDKSAWVAGLAGGSSRRHSKAIHARAPVILESSYIEPHVSTYLVVKRQKTAPFGAVFGTLSTAPQRALLAASTFLGPRAPSAQRASTTRSNTKTPPGVYVEILQCVTSTSPSLFFSFFLNISIYRFKPE